MAPTAAMIVDLRGMVGEPSSETYTDERLSDILSKYPLLDGLGNDPYRPSGTSITPALEPNPYWDPTYDLHLGAADVWDEKAAKLASKFRFSTDGQSFDPQQQYEQAKNEAKSHRAQRSANTIKLWPYPRLDLVYTQVANAPEPPDPW